MFRGRKGNITYRGTDKDDGKLLVGNKARPKTLGATSLKHLKKKNIYQLRIQYPTKISFKMRIKYFFQHKKPREFIASRPALQ